MPKVILDTAQEMKSDSIKIQHCGQYTYFANDDNNTNSPKIQEKQPESEAIIRFNFNNEADLNYGEVSPKSSFKEQSHFSSIIEDDSFCSNFYTTEKTDLGKIIFNFSK